MSLWLATTNPALIALPIVGPLLGGANQELLRIHIKGTIDQPKVSASTFDTVTTTVDQVFKGNDQEHCMNPAFLLPLLAMIGGLASIAVAQNTSPAAILSRIKYDRQCFTIDGKDTFLYSGSFHYFRCPKPLWADRFQKMKDAGLNCVETYVAWNWHEPQPPAGLDDFSKMDMTDLTDWLDMAINRFGFYVILRPGPYICAEWDGGGYPQWLLTKQPGGRKAALASRR